MEQTYQEIQIEYEMWQLTAMLKDRLDAARNRAKQNDREFDIDLDYLKILFHKQDKRCPYTNLKLTDTKKPLTRFGGLETLSIDRIDSTQGYVKGNVEIISSVVNSMKYTLPKEEFIRIINIISENTQKIS